MGAEFSCDRPQAPPMKRLPVFAVFRLWDLQAHANLFPSHILDQPPASANYLTCQAFSFQSFRYRHKICRVNHTMYRARLPLTYHLELDCVTGDCKVGLIEEQAKCFTSQALLERPAKHNVM